jgi:hypothetical protein
MSRKDSDRLIGKLFLALDRRDNNELAEVKKEAEGEIEDLLDVIDCTIVDICSREIGFFDKPTDLLQIQVHKKTGRQLLDAAIRVESSQDLHIPGPSLED